MATKLLYLEDFEFEACASEVQELQMHEDGRQTVILDQTCFYPRGGGQDWDEGTIVHDTVIFNVEEVRLNEQGTVLHIGTFTNGIFKVGQKVMCQVDHERRLDNTRLHSAGHVIEMAMTKLEKDWNPIRGAHYPYMSFVEYEVDPTTQLTDGFTDLLHTKVNDLLKSTYTNRILFISKHEMLRYCAHIPENLPTNKPSRVVLYADDFGIPCGGTHVRTLLQIGLIKITKIKIKKGLAKISYSVDGIE